MRHKERGVLMRKRWDPVNIIPIEDEIDEIWHLIPYSPTCDLLRISHFPKGVRFMKKVNGKVPNCVDRIKIVKGSFDYQTKSYEMYGTGKWIEGRFRR